MTIEWRNEWTGPSVAGAAGLAIGLGVGFSIGYILCSRKKSSIIHYVRIEEEKLEEELEETRVVEPENQVEDVMVIEEEEVEVVSMWADDDVEWDHEAELKTRGREMPYVIHRDEFYNNEKDYSQTTLMYYAGDDVLVDEQDVPIYNSNKVASPLDFGKGSGDPNVVHIRNDHLEAEYEVLRDPGHYAVEVLGQEFEENLPTEKPIIHKMRQD